MHDLAPALTPLEPLNAKQTQILKGAIQVFLQRGYAGTSMDRVAISAGVSKQTIYSHFQDKEGLFRALMEQLTIRRFEAAMHYPEDLQGDPEVILRRVAETYLLKVADREYLAFLRLILAEAPRFPELAHLYHKTVVLRGRQMLAQYFRLHPELNIADPEAVAHIFLGSLVSFVILHGLLDGEAIAPMEKERLVESLMQLLLANCRDRTL